MTNHQINDDRLSLQGFIEKYQIQFTEYFGPDYAYGVRSMCYVADEQLEIFSRVKIQHQSTKGKITTFRVDLGKCRIWRQNVKLYKFIKGKS